MDLQKLGPRRIDPFPFTSRAYVLESLGLQAPALKEIACALKTAPDDIAAYELLGRIYGQRKDHHKAFENFRIAVAMVPSDAHSRIGLARAYERLGDYAGALRQYERLLADKPKDVKIAAKVKKLKTLVIPAKAGIHKEN